MVQLLKISLLFFGVGLSLGFGQETHLEFKAFGQTPRIVPEKFYIKLKNTKNTKEYTKYLDTIAQLFLKSGNADSLVHYSTLMEAELSKIKQDTLFASSYKLKALYFQGIGAQKMGLTDDAISAFIRGIEASSVDDSMHKYMKLELLRTYLYKGLVDKAKPIFDELPKLENDTLFQLSSALVRVEFLYVNHEFEAAKSLVIKTLSNEAIEDFEKLKLELLILHAKINIKEEAFETAISTCTTVKQIALELRFYDIYIDAALNEGMTYAILEEFEIAELALNSAYVNTMQWNRLELQQKVIKALMRLYQVQGDYKNAYALTTHYQAVSEQIANKQNQRLVRDLEFKYETLKKEKEIDKLQEDQLIKQAEINRQKTIKYAFLIGFIAILIPVILLLVVYYQKLQAQSLLNKQQEAFNRQEVKSLMQAQELTLAKNTIAVQHKERDRIARALHDSIGGNLAGIKLKMNSLGDNHPDFKTILSQLDSTYEQVREISHRLIPKEFEDSSFTELVKNYIQNLNHDNAIDLRFKAHPSEAINALDANLQVTLFNIVKELVTNAFKHAKASEIEIQLTSLSEEKSIELLYEDDGVGFDLRATKKGIGLNNLETRVIALKGTFSINTALNRGTVISISIPQP